MSRSMVRCGLTHHESGKPDTTGAEPENPGALRLEELRTRIRSDNSSDAA